MKNKVKPILNWMREGVRSSRLAGPVGGFLVVVGSALLAYNNCSGYDSMKSATVVDSPYTDSGSEYVFTSSGATGNVERLTDNGETLTVSGWACRIGGNGGEKIGVGVSGGNLLGTTYANISREKEVKDACHSESYSHGFSFTISKNQRNANDGKTLYVGVDGISLSSASAFTITKAKDPIEVEHVYIGYLDSLTLSTNGTYTAKGWACLTGSEEIVSVGLFADGTEVGRVDANEFRSDAIKSACGTKDGSHGFTVNIGQKPAGNNLVARVGSAANFTTLKPTTGIAFPLPQSASAFPTISNTTSWTGSGGSTWIHKVTLNSKSGSNWNFSVYSKSTNSALIPVNFETKKDITVQGNGCVDAGSEHRTSGTSGDVYLVKIQACFEFLGGNGNWDVTLQHSADNQTQNLTGAISPSHGTAQIRPAYPVN